MENSWRFRIEIFLFWFAKNLFSFVLVGDDHPGSSNLWELHYPLKPARSLRNTSLRRNGEDLQSIALGSDDIIELSSKDTDGDIDLI